MHQHQRQAQAASTRTVLISHPMSDRPARVGTPSQPAGRANTHVPAPCAPPPPPGAACGHACMPTRMHTCGRLELHEVRPVAVPQGEAAGQVRLQVGAQSGQQRGIQSLLVGHVVGRQLLLLGVLGVKELLLALLGLLGLGSLEVGVGELGQVNGGQGNLQKGSRREGGRSGEGGGSGREGAGHVNKWRSASGREVGVVKSTMQQCSSSGLTRAK